MPYATPWPYSRPLPYQGVGIPSGLASLPCHRPSFCDQHARGKLHRANLTCYGTSPESGSELIPCLPERNAERMAAMEISFDIDGVPAKFRRSPHTNRTELRVGDDVILLQSPYQPSGWFEFRSRRVWRRRVGEHDVEIVKVRSMTPGGGTQAQSYTISVDNTVVAEATGR